MEGSSWESRGGLYGSFMLCLLLAFFMSACNSSPGHASTHHQTAVRCTLVATSSTARGADAAVLATIPVPAQPFRAVATNDGQWIFVSVDSTDAASSGIVILRKTGAQICLLRVLHLDGQPLGLELTRDNRELLVADYSDVALLDVGKAETGAQGAVLGYLPTGANASTIEVALSPDERSAFAANENLNTVSMFDFQRVRAGDFGAGALLGQIPSGQAPVGLAVSPDNRYLSFTSEGDKSVTAATGGLTCPQYGAGSLRVADLARARGNAAHGVVALVAAGCIPVRVVLSAAGDIAWVTARGSNKVLAFSTAKLLINPGQALISAVSTQGAEPVGLALVKHETELIIADSARFSDPNAPQTLSVLDARQALQKQSTLLAEINVGAFPRELFLEADGQTLLLTNYNSNTINFIDVAKLPAPA